MKKPLPFKFRCCNRKICILLQKLSCMDPHKAELYIASHTKYFPSEKFPHIKAILDRTEDSRAIGIYSLELSDPTVMLIVSIFAGHLGVDRFLLGETGLGIAKLLTCGGLGVWTIVDWFIIMGRTKELNYAKLARFTV
jgi:hypothetical protein